MGNYLNNPAAAVEQLSEQVKSLSSQRWSICPPGFRPWKTDCTLPRPDRRAAKSHGIRTPPYVQAQDGPPPLIDTSALLPQDRHRLFPAGRRPDTANHNRQPDHQHPGRLDTRHDLCRHSHSSGLAPLREEKPAGPSFSRLRHPAPLFHCPGNPLPIMHPYPPLAPISILFIAGATVFALSIRHRASILICLGVPGTAAVAMAIDFPYPLYPVLGLLLLSAIVAASYAFKQQMCRYLRWFTLVLAALFWLLWTSKMNTLPACAEPVAEAMYPDWFFPMLFTFWGVYLTTVVLNVLKKDLQLGFFESIHSDR